LPIARFWWAISFSALSMSASLASASKPSTAMPLQFLSSNTGRTSILATNCSVASGLTSSFSTSSMAMRPTGVSSLLRHASPK
jgi:hypothetical protein